MAWPLVVPSGVKKMSSLSCGSTLHSWLQNLPFSMNPGLNILDSEGWTALEKCMIGETNTAHVSGSGESYLEKDQFKSKSRKVLGTMFTAMKLRLHYTYIHETINSTPHLQNIGVEGNPSPLCLDCIGLSQHEMHTGHFFVLHCGFFMQQVPVVRKHSDPMIY